MHGTLLLEWLLIIIHDDGSVSAYSHKQRSCLIGWEPVVIERHTLKARRTSTENALKSEIQLILLSICVFVKFE